MAGILDFSILNTVGRVLVGVPLGLAVVGLVLTYVLLYRRQKARGPYDI